MEQSIQNLDALLSTLENATRVTDQRNACKNIQNWLFEERNKAALSAATGYTVLLVYIQRPFIKIRIVHVQ